MFRTAAAVLFCFLPVWAWPVELTCAVERLPNGNFLLTDAGGTEENSGRVFEVDSLGRTVWAYLGNDIPWVHSGRLTETGTILIAATEANRVIEIDRALNVVWSKDSGLSYPNEAWRLPGNRTLITDRDNDRAIEVDQAGAVVWSYDQLVRPHNASRLPNGNTLVCDSERDRVIEVDSAGNVVWTCDAGFDWPRCAYRLADGHTVIADSRNRRLVEVDSAGSVVWEHSVTASPYSVSRLANGNTLFSAGWFVEIDPDGEVVWQYPNTVAVVVETLRVVNPTSGCSLYVHIHRPAYASSGNPVPGVVLVPDGNYDGEGFDTTGYADGLAEDGFAVMHFDPDGRGRSGILHENYNGHVNQDGLRQCFEVLASRDYVDPGHCGIFSDGYGITMASGAIARHPEAPRVSFLLDAEGPADRFQTCADSGGHVPVPVDSQLFWIEREAASFMKQVPCPYLRLQSEVDRNPRIQGGRHAIALVDSATAVEHGGSGISPWTRVNDSVMNEPNRVYTLQDPPAWIPEEQSGQQDMRTALYLHELARMEFPGIQQAEPPRPAPGIRLQANPVRGQLVLSPWPAADGSRPELLDACGRKVLELSPGPNDITSLAAGAYFIQGVGSGRRPMARVIIAR